MQLNFKRNGKVINIYMINFCGDILKFCLTCIEKEKVMQKLYIDLDRKSAVDKALLKQQLPKQVKDALTQSEISFPILGQSS